MKAVDDLVLISVLTEYALHSFGGGRSSVTVGFVACKRGYYLSFGIIEICVKNILCLFHLNFRSRIGKVADDSNGVKPFIAVGAFGD